MSTVTLDKLIKGNPTTVLGWVRKNLPNAASTMKYFNWSMLAESCARNATEKCKPKEEQLSWAETSIMIYRFLAENSDEDKFEICEMHLRGCLIRMHGNAGGNAILDVNIVTDWFQRRQVMSYEDYLKLANGWQTNNNIHELRLLRALKNRISVIQLLEASGVAVKDFLKWTEIVELLP